MSIPQILLQAGNFIVTAGQALVSLFTFDEQPFIIVDYEDLFEGNCALLVATDTASETEHPFNSYAITYYYCRTAIRVELHDRSSSPLLALLYAHTAQMSVRIVPYVCGKPARATYVEASLRDDMGAPPGAPTDLDDNPCGVAAFIHPVTGEVFLTINTTYTLLPVRVNLQIIADGHSRRGYITITQPKGPPR